MTTENVPLQENERQLRQEVEELLSKIRDTIEHDVSYDSNQMHELAAKALELHRSVESHGVSVKHHRYMLENRDSPADSEEFYRHIHPVEDLLAFLDDIHANDDPEDTTQGISNRVGIYSRRWGHTDAYWFTRSESGWLIKRMEQEVLTGPDGRVGGTPGSGVFSFLDHDLINYPEDLHGYLEWLWQQAAERGLDSDDLRQALEAIAEWINTVERESPAGIFSGYK